MQTISLQVGYLLVLKHRRNTMPEGDKLANISFDLMDFIEDDPEAMNAFQQILEEAVEEWLEMNGYEDWDVSGWQDIDTTVTISGVQLTPEDDDSNIDSDG